MKQVTDRYCIKRYSIQSTNWRSGSVANLSLIYIKIFDFQKWNFIHKITYSEQHFTLHFFRIFPFKDFLLVNHNLSYTILGIYPPRPFRNNQNSPKKISIFPAFPATLFQRRNFQHAKFFQRGKFAGKANCNPNWIQK